MDVDDEFVRRPEPNERFQQTVCDPADAVISIVDISAIEGNAGEHLTTIASVQSLASHSCASDRELPVRLPSLLAGSSDDVAVMISHVSPRRSTCDES